MKRKSRRNHDPAFKTKIVLEALKEQATLAELGAKYDIHPNQITTWKKEFLGNATRAFDGDKQDKSEIKALEEKQDKAEDRDTVEQVKEEVGEVETKVLLAPYPIVDEEGQIPEGTVAPDKVVVIPDPF